MPFVSTIRTVTRHLDKRAHVGIENELAGYSLILLQRFGTGWRKCDIAYGMRAAVSEGRSPVHNLPLAQLQVEGATNGKNGIPEHITGPLRTQTKSFDFMRRSLDILRQYLKTTVTCATPYAEYQGNSYHRLSTILDPYNQALSNLARFDNEPNWKLYRMKANDPFYATWVVGTNKVKAIDAMETQTNVEIPFRAIGQKTGGTDFADQFAGRNYEFFTRCRNRAKALVQRMFAVERRRLAGKSTSDPVDMQRLNSLFTLYYFAVIMHFLNSRPSGFKNAIKELTADNKVSASQIAENRATKNKNQWGLLPKVDWSELWSKALSSRDRAVLRIFIEGKAKWPILCREMTTDIQAIYREVEKHSIHQSLDAGYAQALHDSIMRKQGDGLSDTGKPLPVELAPATKTIKTRKTDERGIVIVEEETFPVLEPLIVFEYRHGGNNTRDFNVQHLGKPDVKLSDHLLSALDGLQGFA